jgi:hypothetical protein
MPSIFQLRLPPITPWASAEISVACGAGSGFGGDVDARRRRSRTPGEQVQHEWNHRRAGPHADDERDLLSYRRRADELSVFKSCRLSFEIVAHAGRSP